MSPRFGYQRTLSHIAYAEVAYTTERGALTTYSVTLVALRRDDWQTVRVYDNAHGVNDMHRHTISEGKRPAETFHYGTPSDAFNAALEMVDARYEEMIAGWLR
jgi:hypothetical protein